MEPCGFLQSRFPRLCCNHSINSVDETNLGYTYGVTEDGIPFEAELWTNESGRCVTFYLPEIEAFNEVEDEPLIDAATGMRTFSTQRYLEYSMVLMEGMVDRGMIGSLSVLNTYIQLLIGYGLISYETDLLNAAGFLITDFAGNDLVALAITLEEDGMLVATTPLEWTPFIPERVDAEPMLRLVK